MDPDKLSTGLKQLSQFISEYWNGLSSRTIAVLPDFDHIKPSYLRAVLPPTAPEKGEELDEILQDFREKLIPGITHWQHPDFHGYYPTSCSYPAILGDLLGSAVAPVGFTWIACPACTELEVIVLDWLVKAMNLPQKFLFFTEHKMDAHFGGGEIECSASLACATLTMGVRERKLSQLQGDWNSSTDERIAGHGPGALVDRMVVYFSDQAHSSVARACRIAMVRCHVIPTHAVEKRLLFDSKQLSEAIASDREKGLIPILCIATMGTTNTCEFDNLTELGEVCSTNDIWLHVDAAYAGTALICPEYRYLSQGIEFADSFNFNPHKLMLVNFDCSVLWLRDHRILSQAFREDPLYLKDSFDGMPEYRNWSINLGRRFRALKLWFVLRMLGLDHMRNLIRQHVALAKHFEQTLLKDGRFEIVNEVRFGLVCFRLKGDNELTKSLQQALVKKRQIYLVAGSLPPTKSNPDSLYFLRFVCNLQTNFPDVDVACSVLCETATEILKCIPNHECT